MASRKQKLHWFHVVQATDGGTPRTADTCATCHDPHATEQDKLIRSSWPIEFNPSYSVKVIYQQNVEGGHARRLAMTSVLQTDRIGTDSSVTTFGEIFVSVLDLRPFAADLGTVRAPSSRTFLVRNAIKH